MRHAILVFFFIVSIIGLSLYFNSLRHSGELKTNPESLDVSSVDEKKTNTTPDHVITFNQNRYAVYLQKINPANLTLIPNFDEKKTSRELIQENNCKAAVNGGFYTQDNKPLGLFITNGKQIQPINEESTLLTGFFYKTIDDSLFIATTTFARGPLFNGVTTSSLSFALQSGPLFTPQTTLKIKDDEYARRILVGQDENNDFYFIAITEIENIHSGPLLGDVPQIITAVNRQLQTANYELLLNLDGGSASAFIDEKERNLSELVSVGSFLCAK